jgi:hypothetical protein
MSYMAMLRQPSVYCSTIAACWEGLLMSWNVALFIEGASSLEALAVEVSALSGLALERVNEYDGETYHQYSERDFTLTLGDDHDLVNDRDLNFEDYTYQICVWRNNTADTEQAEANTLKFAKSLFASFKETGRYRLMLVEDTQKKLDSFG